VRDRDAYPNLSSHFPPSLASLKIARSSPTSVPTGPADNLDRQPQVQGFDLPSPVMEDYFMDLSVAVPALQASCNGKEDERRLPPRCDNFELFVAQCSVEKSDAVHPEKCNAFW